MGGRAGTCHLKQLDGWGYKEARTDTAGMAGSRECHQCRIVSHLSVQFNLIHILYLGLHTCPKGPGRAGPPPHATWSLHPTE